jgi:hypothetical protein
LLFPLGRGTTCPGLLTLDPEFLTRSRSEAAQIAVDARQATEAPGGDLEQVVEDGEGA